MKLSFRFFIAAFIGFALAHLGARYLAEPLTYLASALLFDQVDLFGPMLRRIDLVISSLFYLLGGTAAGYIYRRAPVKLGLFLGLGYTLVTLVERYSAGHWQDSNFWWYEISLLVSSLVMLFFGVWMTRHRETSKAGQHKSTSRFWRGFVLGVISISGVGVLILFSLQKLDQSHFESSESGGFRCFDKPRTGLMSESENDVFSRAKDACNKDDIDSYNALFRYGVDEIKANCIAGQTIAEPNEPELVLELRNIGRESIYYLEQSLKPSATIGDDDERYSYVLSSKLRSNAVKEFKPGEVLKYRVSPAFDGYRFYNASVSYGNWEITSKTEKTMSWGFRWLDKISCGFSWSEK